MNWVRLRLTNHEALRFPPLCPNCLEPVGLKHVHSHTLPFHVSLSSPVPIPTGADEYLLLPHCDACHALVHKSLNQKMLRMFLIGLPTGILGLAFYVYAIWRNWPDTVCGVGVAFVGMLILYVASQDGLFNWIGFYDRKRPPGRCFKLHRKYRRYMVSETFDTEISFRNPMYALEFIRSNESNGTCSYSEKVLRNALAEYKLHHG